MLVEEGGMGLYGAGARKGFVVKQLGGSRIHKFMCLPDPDPLVRGMDPDPDPSIIMQK